MSTLLYTIPMPNRSSSPSKYHPGNHWVYQAYLQRMWLGYRQEHGWSQRAALKVLYPTWMVTPPWLCSQSSFLLVLFSLYSLVPPTNLKVTCNQNGFFLTDVQVRVHDSLHPPPSIREYEHSANPAAVTFGKQAQLVHEDGSCSAQILLRTTLEEKQGLLEILSGF